VAGSEIQADNEALNPVAPSEVDRMETRIKVMEREDGKARIFILERDDGFYRFEGEVVEHDMGEPYWTPCDISGLYESAELAEQAARKEVPWLRQQTISHATDR
jgi:hypothetical protein